MASLFAHTTLFTNYFYNYLCSSTTTNDQALYLNNSNCDSGFLVEMKDLYGNSCANIEIKTTCKWTCSSCETANAINSIALNFIVYEDREIANDQLMTHVKRYHLYNFGVQAGTPSNICYIDKILLPKRLNISGKCICKIQKLFDGLQPALPISKDSHSNFLPIADPKNPKIFQDIRNHPLIVQMECCNKTGVQKLVGIRSNILLDNELIAYGYIRASTSQRFFIPNDIINVVISYLHLTKLIWAFHKSIKY